MARNDTQTKIEQIKTAAEADFETFIRVVQPDRVLGHVHQDLARFLMPGGKSHKLVLLPRDHQKSAFAGLYAAWRITRQPNIRILYISSTANLATKQLKFIKDILTSDRYRRYWPEMVNREEAKREKWTESEISVDHPLRAETYTRDPTVFTAGLTTSVTGLHCDLSIMDDVVVKENAYTEDNRKKVEEQYSLLASIEGTEGEAIVVGTRYHPKDLYNTMMQMEIEVYDEYGELVSQELLYDKFERQVETDGVFLWPRQKGPRGTWFGFNKEILAKKKTQYLDKVQFRAQYYNDPNDAESAGIGHECFQYYDKTHLTRSMGQWYMKGKRLALAAAVDFAYSLKERSDYTAIVVIGVDPEANIYVLDIDRFKSNLPSEYFDHILALHQTWDFRKIKMEVTAAQAAIVNTIKQVHIAQHGLALAVEDVRPDRRQGSKEERIAAVLQPRYQDRKVWHRRGGHYQSLEEELVMENPPHDDIKDALAMAVDGTLAPPANSHVRPAQTISYHPRFGGIM
jgi:hypothetical protein